MIYLLWPTVRPEAMKATYQHWMDNAVRKDQIRVKIAGNTEEQRNALEEFQDVLVIGEKRRGAAYPTYILGRDLEASPDDIVAFLADDIFAPPSWDEWLEEQFRGQSDAIIVNDGGQYGPCVTQPILTFACVLKLNKVIIHPSYHHFCGDSELFNNLSELGLLRDLRGTPGPVFEHRNWAWGKREKDSHDEVNCEAWGLDDVNFRARMQLPVAERLKVDDGVLL